MLVLAKLFLGLCSLILLKASSASILFLLLDLRVISFAFCRASAASFNRGRIAESAPLQKMQILPFGNLTIIDMRFRLLENSITSRMLNVSVIVSDESGPPGYVRVID